MASPRTIDTGWVYVIDGQTTQITLPEGKIVTARVRWRGVEHTTQTIEEASNVDSVSGNYLYFLGGTTCYPSVPSGYDFDRVVATTQVTFATTANWMVRVDPTWTGSASNSGTGTAGIVQRTTYSPPPTGTNIHELDADTTGSMTAKTETFGKRTVDTTYQTQDPQITVDGNVTDHSGTLNDGVESAWYNITGMDEGQVNTILHNVSGSNRVDVQIEVVMYVAVQVDLESPMPFERVEQASLALQLVNQTNETFDNYFPTIQANQTENDFTAPDQEWDSFVDQTNWQYWDGAAWQALPATGAPADASVRFNIATLPVGYWWWRANAYEDDENTTSSFSASQQFRLALVIVSRFSLEIGGVDFSNTAANIRVHETTNGELGSMEFDLYVEDDDPPASGTSVTLAVRDAEGNDEEFIGTIQGTPERGAAQQLFRVKCSLPDAILADRYITGTDYASQDVGLVVEDIIDTYCSPLLSTEVDTTTGFERPVEAFGRTPLDILKELHDQYGFFFWVRSTDNVVFFVLPQNIDPPVLALVRGQVE